MTPKRVTVYTRVSQVKGLEETSTDRQLDACTKYAGSQEWEVVGHHTDKGLSAFKRVDRPGWSKVVADVESGRTDVVLVRSIDRAGRKAADLLTFVNVCKERGVAFASATEPIDTGSPYGGIVIAVLASVAEIESEMKKVRALSKYVEKRASGQPLWTKRSFGYDKATLAIVPTEADAIRHGAEMLLNGATTLSVVKDWNDVRGLKTRTGGRFSVNSLKKVYMAPRIAALQVDTDGTLIRGAWEPILTRGDWERVQAVFDVRRGTNQRTSERYLLTGLVFCGICETNTLQGMPLNHRPRYACRKTGTLHLSVAADKLDAFVIAEASYRVAPEPESIADLSGVSSELLDRLAEVEALLDAQADQLAAGVPAATVAKAAKKLEAERTELLAEMERTAPRGTYDHLVEGDDVTARGALESVVERITIKPFEPGSPRVFDPARVVIEWRPGVEGGVK